MDKPCKRVDIRNLQGIRFNVKKLCHCLNKVEDQLAKAQEKCDELTAKLLELQQQKQDCEAKVVMEAFRKSGRSMKELMTFLGE